MIGYAHRLLRLEQVGAAEQGGRLTVAAVGADVVPVVVGLVKITLKCCQIVCGEPAHLRGRQVYPAAEIFERAVVDPGREIIVHITLDHVDVKRHIRVRGNDLVDVLAVRFQRRVYRVRGMVGIGQVFPTIDVERAILYRQVGVCLRQAQHRIVPDAVLRVVVGFFHRLCQRDLVAERSLHRILKRPVQPAGHSQRCDGVGRAVFVVVHVLRPQQCAPESGQQHQRGAAEHDRIVQIADMFVLIGSFHVRFLPNQIF